MPIKETAIVGMVIAVGLAVAWLYNSAGSPTFRCEACGKDSAELVGNDTALCYRCGHVQQERVVGDWSLIR